MPQDLENGVKVTKP